MLSHLSDTSVSIRNLKFLSDIFVSSFKHWSTLPTYPFALSSDSIIISQFLSFVKSFFCELSVICSRLAFASYAVYCSALLALADRNAIISQHPLFVNTLFRPLFFSVFRCFPCRYRIFRDFTFFSFLKFVDLQFISFDRSRIP